MTPLIEAEPSLFAAVLAGWVCGFAIALASTGYFMFGLSRTRLRPLPDMKVSLLTFGIVATNALMITWTLVGIGAGVGYYVAGPTRFTTGIIAIHALAALVYAVARGRLVSGEACVIWATLFTSIGMFLGLLPFLATRA